MPRLNPRAFLITIFLTSFYQASFSQTDTEKVFSVECNPCAANLASTTRWGVMNSKTRKVILPALFDQVELLGSSFYWVRQNGKSALFKKEKAITDFIFENKYRPQAGVGVFGVVVNGKWGCIDTTGREILATKYDWVKDQDAHRGVLAVKFQGKWSVADLQGKEILPAIYDELVDLELYILEKDKMYHVFNPVTRKLSPHTFEEVYTERNDRCMVKLNGRYGYLDRSGEMIIQPNYDKATNFEVQRAGVSLEGKWGFIDPHGVEVTPIIYEAVRPFTVDFAPIKLNGKWGFVDLSGKEVIAPQYIDVQQGFYENPAAVVRVKDPRNASRTMVCLINRKGAILSAAFDGIDGPDDGVYRVMLSGKYGFIDMTGKLIIPCLYQDAERFYKGKVKVMKDNSWYYVDKTGKKL